MFLEVEWSDEKKKNLKWINHSCFSLCGMHIVQIKGKTSGSLLIVDIKDYLIEIIEKFRRFYLIEALLI